jgi:hypothetical protein
VKAKKSKAAAKRSKHSQPRRPIVEARFTKREELVSSFPRGIGSETFPGILERLLPGFEAAWARYCDVMNSLPPRLHDAVESVCWEQQAYGEAAAYMAGVLNGRGVR